MAITQSLVVEQIEVTSNNTVQIRQINQYVDDSTKPATVTFAGYQRHVICPGDDYSKEEPKVQAICAAIHTPEVVAQYKAEQEANQSQI